MKTTLRKYSPEKDFLRVRDFLVNTYKMTDQSINWTLERWNYARYFVLPMIGSYGVDPVSIADSQKAIQFWEDHIRLWENSAGDIVAVTAFEHPWLGDVFFLRHPEYNHLLEEMYTDAEENLLHPERANLQTHIFEHDKVSQDIALKHGFIKNKQGLEDISEFNLQDGLPAAALPSGYEILSIADENNLDRRRKAFGRGFNHEDPIEWPSLFSYQELQRAPDYRKELDLYVRSQDGEYVSFCITWWDDHNQLGTLEPVGTVPEHRRKGLARAVVMEGIRRVAALGAKKVLVGSGQDFYTAIGFKKTLANYTWVKDFS